MPEEELWRWEVGYEEWRKSMLNLLKRQRSQIKNYRERLKEALKLKDEAEIQYCSERIEELEKNIKYNSDLLKEAREYRDTSVFFITSEGKLEMVLDVPWFKREYERRRKESEVAYL